MVVKVETDHIVNGKHPGWVLVAVHVAAMENMLYSFKI